MKNKYIYFVMFSCSLISMGMMTNSTDFYKSATDYHFKNVSFENDSISPAECAKRVEAALEKARIEGKIKPPAPDLLEKAKMEGKKAAEVELAPKIEAAKKAAEAELAPKIEAAKKAVEAELAPKIEAAKKAVEAELAPKIEAAKKAAEDMFAPKIEAAKIEAKKGLESELLVAKTAATSAQNALNAKERELDAKKSEFASLKKTRDDLEATLGKLKKAIQEKGNTDAIIAEAENKLEKSKADLENIKKEKDAADVKAKDAEAGQKAAQVLADTAISDAEKAKTNTMIAIVAGLVLTLIVFGYYLYQSRKTNRKLKEQNEVIDTKSKELKQTYENLKKIVGEKQDLEDSLERMEKELAQKKKEQGNIQDVIEATKEKGKELGAIFPQLKEKSYFFAETMTSAGPRKNDEIGLGEDVTGMLVREDFACFWIFDGVSDNHILKNDTGEYFSSRLLAQSLALGLQMQLSNINFESFDLQMALEKACTQALKNIQEKIDKLLISEKKQLLNAIQKGDIPTIATTVLVGLLSKQGNLKIYRIGVDKWLALPNGQLIDPKKDGAITDRIAFSLDESNGQLVVKMAQINDLARYAKSLDNISTVIGATDGVSSTLLNWLKAQKQLDLANPNIRKIIANNRDYTGDDKSLCIIQLKQLN
jgi:uncharacterized membrane protein YciS (DUF1049 family)